MIVRFRNTTEHGLTPNGVVSAPNLLKFLDEEIVALQQDIELSLMNGEGTLHAEGSLFAYKRLKLELFGGTYST